MTPNQPDLFENVDTKAHARHGDPETSKQAAAKQTPAKLRASQARVKRVFEIYGAMYDRQLVEYTENFERASGLKPQSPSGIRSRRAELVRLGVVIDTGRRELVDGHNVVVWGIAK